MSNKRLIKSTGVISIATFCSRMLGFARDILIANLFGTTIFAEAFVVSFRIPNMLRDLVGEGAANAAFVPVLTEYHATRSNKEFWRLANDLLLVIVVALFIISVAGVLFAPVLVRIIAPGFTQDPAKLALTINLTQLMFPFIFLVGLMAYGIGILNSLNRFAAGAFAPTLLNVGMIFFLIVLCPKIGISGLAVGVLFGGLLQIFLIALSLRKSGFQFIGYRDKDRMKEGGFIHPAVKRIWKLLVPRFFGSAVYQMSVIVDNIFSTFESIVGIGAPAGLWYAYRLFHLPLAMFGIALSTAALPRMSREVAQNDIPALKKTIGFSIKIVFLILIPAGIGLATMGKPIIRILFQRGEFTAYSAYITNSALFFYSFGLFACGGIKILVNAFFSLGDTKTPVKVAGISFFINLVLNFALMWPLKIGGLALATSIAATSNFIMLYKMLIRKIGHIDTQETVRTFVRILCAGTLMGIFSFTAARFLDGAQGGIIMNLFSVSLVIVVSVAIYVAAGLALGISEMKRFIRWILRRS